jgi:Do/DeqQ family serine protease
MKQFLSFLLAAIAGGLIALGGVSLMQDEIIAQTETFEAPSQQVNFVNKRPVPEVAIFDFTKAAELANPVVVHISAKAGEVSANNNNYSDDPFRFFFGDDSPMSGSGSGVIYTSDGYIVTNNHVVEFADKLEVTLYDNRKFNATVVGTNKKTDLAIIKIEANDLPTLVLADSDNARVGEWTLAVGNPFDLTSTVTAGIISAKGRSLRLLKDRDAIESFIQTDAAVNPGNSGGALIDATGRLLGINTAIASQSGVFQGYSFAIPINLVKRIADDIIEYGSYHRAFLGVNIYPLDSESAQQLGVNISQGVVIERLEDKGSAQYAGLYPKDVIVKVDSKEIKGVPDLAEIIGTSKVGDVLDVTINRKGRTMTIPVKMRAEPDN